MKPPSLEVLELAYHAFSDRTAQVDLLSRVTMEMQGNNASLCTIDTHRDRVTYNSLHVPNSFIDRYKQIIDQDPWIVASRSRQGLLSVRGTDLVAQTDYRRSEVYPLSKEIDIEYMAGCGILGDVAHQWFLVVNRGMSAGDFDVSARDYLSCLAPHLGRASSAAAVADYRLDAIGAPCIEVGSDTSAHANAQALRLLDSVRGVHLQAGVLRFADEGVQRALDAAVTGNNVRPQLYRLAGGPPDLHVLMVPRLQPRSLGLVSAGALVLLIPEDRIAQRMGDMGLTATEQAVARLLVDGYSVREIAASMERSLHTTRTHLRAIFRKAGVRAQRDLVRKLLG